MKELIRAHGQSLGSGKIRACNADFEVTELYDFEPTGQGEHLLLWIEKDGANTGWVGNQLAKHFGVRHFDVSYCGKKDRHAITRQWFSCYLPNGEIPESESIQIEGVKVLKATRHSRKLRRGEHSGNRFRLNISALDVKDRDSLEERLEAIAERGVPNYFGRQRFGRDGQNYHKACELLADPELRSRRKLDRKQKDIYVSALRSWLFNDVLTEEVTAGSWCDGKDLWVYGLAPHRDIEIPRPDVEHAEAVEFIESIGVKAHQRAKQILPKGLKWQLGTNSLRLEFELPVGAFATTVLEEMIKIEEGHHE